MNTPSILLRAIGSALPATHISAEQIEEWTGSPVDFQRDKLGILSRGVLGADETGVSLAQRACEDLFARSGLLPEDVDLLVFVTQTPDHGIPHNAALLHAALGLADTCACFDLGLGCSGFVYGLSVVRGFMLTEGLSCALLVTCDPYTRIMGRQDRDTMAVFGDAATASWLSVADPASGATQGQAPLTGAALGKGIFGTDGKGAGHLILRTPRPEDTGIFPHAETPPENRRLYMNGRAIFNFMMQRIQPALEACLAKNGLTRDDVDLFVFHQASRFMLQTLTRHLGLPPDKVPVDLAETGNTVSSSIPLTLQKLGSRLAGKTVLVCGFGVGLSWAANILHYPSGEQQ